MATLPPLGFSYIRFSSPEQLKGDSLRRQDDGAAAWCERNGVRLDTSLSLRDLGVSAFKGKHRDDKHDLGKFLKLIEAGRVPKGAFFIIENLDRLSREDERTALRLWMDILDHGVNIVQLTPETVFRHEKSDMFDIMRAIMELSRGHGESARKSGLLANAWGEKKRRVRDGETQKATKRMGDGCKVLTRSLPGWVEERGGKLVAIPDRAAVVQRIFQMAADGYGLTSIIRQLTADGIPSFGDSGIWNRTYIARILKDRRALGEYQPCFRSGKPDGEPVPNYYPAVVTEDQWHAIRAGAAQRRLMPGRIGQHVNVFQGLLRNARDGDTYYCMTRKHGEKRDRILINLNGTEGRSRGHSFPFAVFEAAILSCLREIDPHEILNGDAAPDESLVLAGELARVDTSIEALTADMDEHGESPTLMKRVRDKEAQKRTLVEKLAEAKQKAANPLSEAWGEAQSLLETLADPQEGRLRLRGALRRIVDSIWLLVIPRGADRLCAVQIWFAGGKRHRDYLILHRPAKANAAARKEGAWWTRSLATVAKAGDLDLRKPAHAKRLAAALAAADLDGLK